MRAGFICAAVLALSATPVAAQQGPAIIAAPAHTAWLHQRSGITLPARIGVVAREGIQEYAPDQMDVAGAYFSPDRKTAVNIYLFRPQIPDIGLWYSQAELGLLNNPRFTNVRPVSDAPVAFTPHGVGAASGLRRSFTAEGQYHATALAILPTGRWIIKIRASSLALSPDELSALIDAALAEITFPATARDQPAARAVAPCAPLMRWRSARPAATTVGDSMMGALLSLGGRGEASAPSLPANLCRDISVGEGVNYSYRDPSDADTYWIGIGDNGPLVAIHRRMGVTANNRDTQLYGINLLMPSMTYTFRSYSALPSPQQVIQTINTTEPSSSSDYDPDSGEGATLTISPSALR